MQPAAVAGQCGQAPLGGDVGDAAQVEAGEAEGCLDDAEDGFDALLAAGTKRATSPAGGHAPASGGGRNGWSRLNGMKCRMHRGFDDFRPEGNPTDCQFSILPHFPGRFVIPPRLKMP